MCELASVVLTTANYRGKAQQPLEITNHTLGFIHLLKFD